jgi:hypothetical protein
MRAEQTVSEMVVEALARQAAAGRRLAELADGPHRHEKAAVWQAGLMDEREAQRPAHLRASEGGWVRSR